MNEIVIHNGVKIVGYGNVPGRVAKDASALYSKNIFIVLKHAKANNFNRIGFLGNNGGKAKKYCNLKCNQKMTTNVGGKKLLQAGFKPGRWPAGFITAF